jgi:hypothetical protein
MRPTRERVYGRRSIKRLICTSARPDYPDELFDRLLEVTGLGRGARLLDRLRDRQGHTATGHPRDAHHLYRTQTRSGGRGTQQRERLYSEIRRRLEARPDRRLRRGWGAVLHIGRRR